jgi:hypothetical protein
MAVGKQFFNQLNAKMLKMLKLWGVGWDCGRVGGCVGGLSKDDQNQFALCLSERNLEGVPKSKAKIVDCRWCGGGGGGVTHQPPTLALLIYLIATCAMIPSL